MPDKLIYEQPLNERIRSFLRLEFLFQQVRHHLEGSTEWDSRSALSSLLESMAIFRRSDLKSEVIKEVEKVVEVPRLVVVPSENKDREMTLTHIL